MHRTRASPLGDNTIRQSHSAAEIRDEVARVLNARRRFSLRVPLPVPAPRAPENLDCNWDMSAEFRAQAGYQIEIGLALLSVKKRWDLQESDSDETPSTLWG
jgi:hypothetical protein